MPTVDTHDAPLATLPDDRRAALQTFRDQIRAAPPDARGVVRYGIPAFRIGPGKGKVLVGCGALKADCGFCVFEGESVGRFADRLAEFSIAKGPNRFPPARPIPTDLVAEMVRGRRAEIG